MQDYQILLNARQRQQDLRHEAAVYQLARSAKQAAHPNMLQRTLGAVGMHLIHWGEQLQSQGSSGPVATTYPSRQVKRHST